MPLDLKPESVLRVEDDGVGSPKALPTTIWVLPTRAEDCFLLVEHDANGSRVTQVTLEQLNVRLAARAKERGETPLKLQAFRLDWSADHRDKPRQDRARD